MDVKTTQLSYEMLRQAFLQSRDARGQILDVMTATLPTHRPQLSPYAPRIETLKIPVDKIGAVIGPGGKNIRRITEDTGAQIEIDDDGSVQIISKDDASREKAILIIRGMTEEPQVGQIYRNVKVSRILSFGAMVEYLPGQEGLVHVSELDHRYVSKVEDIAKVGDTMDVKIVGIDDQHRVNLSRKALMEVPPGLDKENSSAQQARGPRRERSDFSGRQSGRPQPKLTHRAFRSGPGKDKQR
ncbi:MAG: Polyribonucleotide nucleotidyltransferase [candidate division TA06 bacterium ADurb.Bin417]|uniref:Polyribonucleotide nucleotidyltransferase n=1 Tax=candidate division TA06 bacterium ADurb.Bin417 TaxID=1852828 RepID=A0A1V5MA48_UNCT6|nr:MAG: Polyribonucleotide nucleotidyltransferase [candidate division TA06 bacterium ADurb.Bin417]